MNALERRLAQALRIPPQPDPPAGSDGSVRVFRAARPFFFYLLAQWTIAQIGSFFGIVFGLRFASMVPHGFWSPLVGFLESFGIAIYVLQIPVTLLGVSIDYKLRWYMVTDRSLRIREGVYRVRERTMSFANIQNLSLRRGPLQQLLGISDVEVRSAGGGEGSASEDKGGTHDDLHRGLFRGVADGEAIRDLILRQQRRLRDTGLGDPDDVENRTPDRALVEEGTPQRLVEAARALAEEAAALRRTAFPGG